MKKALIAILSSLILALCITFFPIVFDKGNKPDISNINETSLVKQEILSYSQNENTYTKMYASGKLVGIVTDMNRINDAIAEKYHDYEKDFPDTSLGLSEDVYLTEEKSYAYFEDVDDKIIDYIINNDYLGVKTTSIEFYTSKGVYEIIYVKSYDDFLSARDKFLTNFISEEALEKIRRNEPIEGPTDIGSVEIGVSVEEKVSKEEVVCSPDKIFKNEAEIYEFLCYGRDKDREYYTVKEGDTLQAVGNYFGGMSAKQIYMLNHATLSSENQVITPGMELNVKYYTSPVTVDITKERLSLELITPESPIYIEDDTLEEGKFKVIEEEEIGMKNVLYQEKWVNGVLESGEKKSETIITQPKQGVIAVGTLQVIAVGTGNFIFPIDNPYVMCDYGCYLNHTGTDFINLYERYAPIYAADSGVVIGVGYKYDMGYYVYLDHNNGFKTIYMHMNTWPYVSEGENVARGQNIGQMGNTGRSDGVHLHFTVEVNGTRVDSCRYLPCYLAR